MRVSVDLGRGSLVPPMVLLQGREQAALGRLDGAISPVGTSWEAREEEDSSRTREAVYWSCQRVSNPAGEIQREIVTTQKASVFLMHLHSRDVAVVSIGGAGGSTILD